MKNVIFKAFGVCAVIMLVGCISPSFNTTPYTPTQASVSNYHRFCQEDGYKGTVFYDECVKFYYSLDHAEQHSKRGNFTAAAAEYRQRCGALGFSKGSPTYLECVKSEACKDDQSQPSIWGTSAGAFMPHSALCGSRTGTGTAVIAPMPPAHHTSPQ